MRSSFSKASSRIIRSSRLPGRRSAQCCNWAWRHDAAESAYRKALTIDAARRDARFGVASSLLSRGRYDEGLAEFDASREASRPPHLRYAALAAWTRRAADRHVGAARRAGPRRRRAVRAFRARPARARAAHRRLARRLLDAAGAAARVARGRGCDRHRRGAARRRAAAGACLVPVAGALRARDAGVIVERRLSFRAGGTRSTPGERASIRRHAFAQVSHGRFTRATNMAM